MIQLAVPHGERAGGEDAAALAGKVLREDVVLQCGRGAEPVENGAPEQVLRVGGVLDQTAVEDREFPGVVNSPPEKGSVTVHVTVEYGELADVGGGVAVAVGKPD